MPNGGNPTSLAVSADGARLYVSRVSFRDLTSSPTSDQPSLPHRAPPGRSVARGLVFSAAGATLAGVLDSFPLPDQSIASTCGNSEIPPNRGGVRLRPVDALTREPIFTARISGSSSEGYSFWVDVAAAPARRAPMVPGTYSVRVQATGYHSVVVPATVDAGSWTDSLARSPWLPPDTPGSVTGLFASPPCLAGTTADVVVHGAALPPGTVVTSTSPDVTVNSYARRSWESVDVNLTTAAMVVGTHYPLLVTLPGGCSSHRLHRRGRGLLGVGSATQPDPLPLRGEDPRRRRSPGLGRPAGRPATRSAARLSRLPLDQRAHRGLRLAPRRREAPPPPTEEAIDPGAVASTPPFSTLTSTRVRRAMLPGDRRPAVAGHGRRGPGRPPRGMMHRMWQRRNLLTHRRLRRWRRCHASRSDAASTSGIGRAGPGARCRCRGCPRARTRRRRRGGESGAGRRRRRSSRSSPGARGGGGRRVDAHAAHRIHHRDRFWESFHAEPSACPRRATTRS